MQNVATYPLSHQLAANSVSRGSLLTYVRTVTLSVWLMSLIFRYWWLSDWLAIQQEILYGTNARIYYFVGFAIALVAHLTMGIGAWMALPFKVVSTWSGRLFTAFCIVALVTAPLSVVPRSSAIYAVATWGVLALLCLYWQNNYFVVRRMIVFTGIVLLGWMYLLLLKHGWQFGVGGGVIGGMNRNATAFATLGGTICCMLSTNKWLRWFAICTGLLIAMLVTSRGAMLALGVFVTVYYIIDKGTFKAAAYGILAFVVAFAVLIASDSMRHIFFEDVMRLHDKARGIGSGFTGRLDYWKQAIEAFWDRPVFGYGLRASTHGGGRNTGTVHSGYLKILVETGFVGAFLMMSAVVIEFVRRFRLALQYRALPPNLAPGMNVVETARVNAIVCSSLALVMTMWIYEQLYINLGSVITVVFFLMMAAPAFITTQGQALRSERV
jgi:O-antigen ligase